jgi:hypothetical protein
MRHWNLQDTHFKSRLVFYYELKPISWFCDIKWEDRQTRAVSSHFCLSSQGHQVASAVRLCSRHVTLVALRNDGGHHLYYTYTSGHILRSVSLLSTVRRYRKMNDKTQSRNSQSCCDSCSKHYLSVLFLVGVGFWELRGDLQVLSRCICEEFAFSIWWGHFIKIMSKNQTFLFEQNSILCNWTISV